MAPQELFLIKIVSGLMKIDDLTSRLKIFSIHVSHIGAKVALIYI